MLLFVYVLLIATFSSFSLPPQFANLVWVVVPLREVEHVEEMPEGGTLTAALLNVVRVTLYKMTS